MLPKIIVHNSISADGSLTDFDIDLGLHYQIARKYRPDAHLIGSNTAKTGIESFGGGAPEGPADFEKPKRSGKLPYWVIADSKGALKGLLHNLRRFELCRDVIVLVSEKTPKSYLRYLQERKYSFLVAGEQRVDFKKALPVLARQYKIKKILTDTGRVLSNHLLSEGLVSELSLLVHPVIVGSAAHRIFTGFTKTISLRLITNEKTDNGCVRLVYKVRTPSRA